MYNVIIVYQKTLYFGILNYFSKMMLAISQTMDRSATVNHDHLITVHGQFKSNRLELYCQMTI